MVSQKLHYNQNLPPVDIPILVWHKDAWTAVKRTEWATSREGNIKFTNNIIIHSSKIRWRYK